MVKPGASTANDNRFQRQGDVWSISYGGENALIPAALGLEYIAMLLREPLRSIEALRIEALSSSTGSPIQSSAQTDQDALVDELDSHYERSDAKAIQQYKGRALVLNEAIRDARDRGDDKRTEQLIAELEAIEAHLAADTGLAGRARTFADDTEKARVRVTQAINRALKKIAERAPKTADYLESTIETGTSMTYRDAHTSWKV